VVEALRRQTLSIEDWELLIIDNGSTDPISNALDLSWHPAARHVFEPTLGLTPARIRGIHESRASTIVFVDDDNVLHPDYLIHVVELTMQQPALGAFGAGELTPEFEERPSKTIVPWLGFLALRTVEDDQLSSNFREKHCLPWGAGLSVSRDVANQYIGLVNSLGITSVLDRRGDQLFAGGDDLFSLAAVRAEKQFGIFPRLKVLHLISAGRLSEQYLIRLGRAHAYSHAILDFMVAGNMPEEVSLGEKIRMVAHGLRRGQFSYRWRKATLEGREAARSFIREGGLVTLGETADENSAVDTEGSDRRLPGPHGQDPEAHMVRQCGSSSSAEFTGKQG
jgi:glycosyltransferase involved in cell wall biosynthesis